MERVEKEINHIFLSDPFLFLHLKERRKEGVRPWKQRLFNTHSVTVSGNKRDWS